MVADSVIREAVRRLAEGFDARQIILFGSYARGTADSTSDVDLLVICPVSGDRRALLLGMDRALKGLGLPRDIVVLTQEEFERDRELPGTVARPAWREGKILYDSAA